MNEDALSVDCLLGVVGLMPEEVTRRQMAQAATLPEKFAARAKAWWNRKEPAAYKDVKVGDLDELFDKISAEPTREEIEQWHAAAGDDAEIIEDFTISLKNARTYLKQQWPRIQLVTFAGTRLADLSVEDEAEVASLFAVLNEPTRVLDEMDSATLSPSQATAFRQVYPSLYGHYWDAIQLGAADKGKGSLEWMPDESQEIALAILTGKPQGALPYESEQQQGQAPKQDKDLGAAAVRTQADQSAKPVGVK